MKPFILFVTVILLTTNCSKDNQHNNISQYREQYSEYANACITNNNTNLTAVLSNRLEQFKQTNLYLFNRNK